MSLFVPSAADPAPQSYPEARRTTSSVDSLPIAVRPVPTLTLSDYLERLTIYVALADAKAERTGYLRIIDESGEDYLHPSQRFVAAKLPVSTQRSVLKAA